MTPEQKYCIKCQLCCKRVYVSSKYWLPGFSEAEENAHKVKEYFQALGFKVVEDESKETYGLWLNYHCPQLTHRGCKIYNKRPRICREFNGNPNDMEDMKVCVYVNPELLKAE